MLHACSLLTDCCGRVTMVLAQVMDGKASEYDDCGLGDEGIDE